MKYIIIILILLTTYSCHQYPTDMKKALRYSEKNKKELVKVIEHYKKTNETQKLEAVYYLYSNMTYKYHLEGSYYDSLQTFYECLSTDKVYLKERDNDIGFRILKRIVDSTYQFLSPHKEQLEIAYDIKNIGSSYLIENIDMAFKVWKNVQWEKNITFKTFLEYILPYKISTESPEHWRRNILFKYFDIYKEINKINNIDTAFHFLLKKTESKFQIRFPFEFNYMSFDKTFNHYDILRIGDCAGESDYIIYFMRAFGIPTAIDYLLNWGNFNARHTWVELIKPNEKRADTILITNINNRKNTNNIISSSFTDCLTNSLFDNNDIQYKRTVPKVYRKMFSFQENIIKLNEAFPDQMHPNFKDYYMKDVTDEYIECGSVTINLQKKDNDIDVVYLCVFSTNGWNPVDIKVVSNNKVTFNKVGKNVIFLPMSYKNNKLSPLGSAFYLDSDNEKNNLIINKDKTHTVTLKRKYPLFGRIAEYANNMFKSRFTVSKTINYRDTINIYTVENPTIVPTYFDVYIPDGYNYLKFTPPDGYRVVFAELEFFYRDNGILKKLNRKDYKTITPFIKEVEILFDNNYGTIVNSPPFTIKFINTTKKTVKMRYCPRSDTNFIESGDNYELFYWDEAWISLGTNKATDVSIIYKNVPKGALLWLRDLTKGKEERIFTYENEKQIWW